MPDALFVLVSFAVHMSLALWIGGAVFFGALAAPRVFGAAPSRTQAGEIVGGMVGAFAKWKLGCMAVLILGTWFRYARWEAWNDWIAVRFTLVAAACVLEILATHGVGPRIMAAREELHSAGLDFDGDPADPRRRRFRRLHGMVMGLQSLAVLCAAGALLTFF
ncbi:MAG: DUF4149 domain-containing protein [Deltaproteobacteria bacterium]|nr:DUF4149 domain-containing protein [Deltaproteobacteria bacterium]